MKRVEPAKLRRDTLAEQVAQSLMEFVETQDVKPGESLPSEGSLAASFGVSRPVIREALKSLKALGVITIINGRGAIVRPMTSDLLRSFFGWAVRVKQGSLLQLYEVRKGIEVQSAILAAERRTPEELAEMARVVARMRQHLSDPEAYTELDAELHLLIAASTRNPMMYHLVESIREPMKGAIRDGLRRRSHDERQIERVQVLHESVLAALEQGNAQEAERAMALHFDEAVATLMAGVNEANKSDAGGTP